MTDHECPLCGSRDAGCVGGLGSLLHICCRACGIWYEHEMTDEEREEVCNV